MRKKIFYYLLLPLFSVGFIYISIGLLVIFGGMSTINNVFNSLFNPITPSDKKCVVDADCVFWSVTCGDSCGFGKHDAVNKNYQPFCPIEISTAGCPSVPYPFRQTECKSNVCVISESVK